MTVSEENVKAVRSGISNLSRHVNNIKKFGLPVIVAINHFVADTDQEIKALQEECNKINVEAIPCHHWSKGGAGTVELAKKVVKLVDQKNEFKFLYENKISLFDKIKTIATKIYGASSVSVDTSVRKQIEDLQDKIAKDKGYEIVKHVHHLFVKPIKKMVQRTL